MALPREIYPADFSAPLQSAAELASAFLPLSLKIQQAVTVEKKIELFCTALVDLASFSYTSIVLLKADFTVSCGTIALHRNVESEMQDVVADFAERSQPGRVLDESYYEPLFAGEAHRVLNTYCVDTEAFNRAYRGDVSPEVPEGLKSLEGLKSSKSPTEILFGIYNPSSLADDEHAYTVYVPIRASTGRLFGFVSFGQCQEERLSTPDAMLSYQRLFEAFIRQVGTELEDEAIRRRLQSENEALLASQATLRGLTAFVSEVQMQKTLAEKLKVICKAIVRLDLAAVSAVVLFDGDYLIEETNFFVKNSADYDRFQSIFTDQFARGASLNTAFYKRLFSTEHRISDSYVSTSRLVAQIQKEVSGNPIIERIDDNKEADSERNAVKDCTIFTPLYNRDKVLIGYISSALSRPNERRLETVQAIELYARIIEKDIELFRNYEFELRQRTQMTRLKAQMQELFNFSATIKLFDSIEYKANIMAKSIADVCEFESCSVILYNTDGSIEHTVLYAPDLWGDALHEATGALQIGTLSQRRVTNRIFSTALFRIENSYCFNVSHVAELIGESIDFVGRSTLTRMNVDPSAEFPDTIWQPNLAETNLRLFSTDPHIGVFTPIKVNDIIFGYVGLGAPKQKGIRAEDIREQLKIMSLFIDEVAGDILQAKLEGEKEKYVRRTETLKELLETLFAASNRIQSAHTVEEKFQIAVDTVVDSVGFQEASMIAYNEFHVVTTVAFAMNSEVYNEADYKRYASQVYVGKELTRRAFELIQNTPEFEIGGGGYCYHVNQVAALGGEQPHYTDMRGKPFDSSVVPPMMEPLSPSTGFDNLSRYLAGEPGMGLMFLLRDASGRVVGDLSLGDLVPSLQPQYSGMSVDEFIERLKIVSVFMERLAQDYKLTQLSALRDAELEEKKRLSTTLSLLFEVGTEISQRPSLSDKLTLLTEAIVSATKLDLAIACLCKPNGEITHAEFYFDPGYSAFPEDVISEQYRAGNTLNFDAFRQIFETSSFRLNPFRVYCADLRDLHRRAASELTTIGSNAPRGEIVVPLSGSDRAKYMSGLSYLERFLATQKSAEQDFYVLTIPLSIDTPLPPSLTDGKSAVTPPQKNPDEAYQGMLVLGNFTDTNALDEVLSRLQIIDLFVSIVAADLTKFRLTESLRLESERLRVRNRFIQTLLELGAELSLPLTRRDKAQLVCERIVSNSDFSDVTCLLFSGDDYTVGEFCLIPNPRGGLDGAREMSPQFDVPAKDKLSTLYLDLSFQEEHRVSNSYCYDTRWMLRQMDSLRDKSYILNNGERRELPPVAPDEKALSSADAFLVFCGLKDGQRDTVNFLVPMYASSGALLGMIALGSMMEGVQKEQAEVLSDIRLIELIAGTLASNLENADLNLTLAKSEAKYKSIVENVDYGFIISNRAGEAEYVNPYLLKTLGYTETEMLGQQMRGYIRPDLLPEFEAQLQNRQEEKISSEYEMWLRGKSGEYFPFRVSATPQFRRTDDGKFSVEGSFGVLTDLRKEKAFEAQELALQTIRDNFFAMVMHDMKVPLSAIYGYSQYLKDVEPQTIESARFKDIMSQLHLSSENITKLVQDILDFSKYESKMVRLSMRIQDFILAIELVMEQNQFDVTRKRLRIERDFEQPEIVFAFDFDKIVRVLMNLVSNAVKFTPEDGTLCLRCRTMELKDGVNQKTMMAFSIADTGEGISADEVGLIFDAYRQANSKHGSRGTGLGLSIAKQIVELHGGTIHAESELGKGTTLTFTLPVVTE